MPAKTRHISSPAWDFSTLNWRKPFGPTYPTQDGSGPLKGSFRGVPPVCLKDAPGGGAVGHEATIASHDAAEFTQWTQDGGMMRDDGRGGGLGSCFFVGDPCGSKGMIDVQVFFSPFWVRWDAMMTLFL